MKFFVLVVLLGLGGWVNSQDVIPSDAKYLGKWVFDGDNDEAPRMFDDLPQYELFFASDTNYSYISFPAHDELGYPQAHYFQAKVKDGKMTGITSHWPGGTIQEGEEVAFHFTFKLAKIDIFSLKWKGKWYKYRRA